VVGSGLEDRIGSYQSYSLGSDKFLILSPQWGSAGTFSNGLGAVTWVNGATGALSTGAIGGTVSASNSLVGAAAGDVVGSIYPIPIAPSGNVVILSPQWGSGGVSANAKGAVTWINGSTGALSTGDLGGAVGAANSVVGAAAGDGVGSYSYINVGGNFITRTAMWGSGGNSANALGAITWINGLTGKLSDGTSSGGVISSSNSLVGSTPGDKVGTFSTPIPYAPYVSDQPGISLAGNNLLISSNSWNNGGTLPNAGAVTWMDGTSGRLMDHTPGGAISAANSLIGGSAGDRVGTSISLYTNNNISPASTSTTYSTGLIQLNYSGNYLVRSGLWGSGGSDLSAKGAVTWFNGATGTNGVVSNLNSIVGTTAGDLVGVAQSDYLGYTYQPGYVVLPNNNYVVISSSWGSGRGAVTWGNGATGTSGDVSGVTSPSTGLAPSVVGALTSDRVGALGINVQYFLTGSNYLISSPWFDDAGNRNDAGALTWVNGDTGVLSDTRSHGGAVSAANSLVGNFAFDNVGTSGGTWTLSTGNFLAITRVWGSGQSGGAGGKGAVTWINGTNGQLSDGLPMGAYVTSSNSLVGATAGDLSAPTIYQVGPNFNNVLIQSNAFTNGAAANAGSVTWLNGTDGHLVNGGPAGGVLSAANSLVGEVAESKVGSDGITRLPGDKLLIQSRSWSGLVSDQIARTNAGAVTWMDGATGKMSDSTYSGAVSTANSLVGTTANDHIGSSGISVNASTGNVLIRSQEWDNGAQMDAGAVTWMDSSTGLLSDGATGGVISPSNSLVADTSNTYLGNYAPIALNNGPSGSGAVVLRAPQWSGYKGAVTWMNTADGSLNNGLKGGIVSAANSLVGTSTTDYVGNAGNGVTLVANDAHYVVHSSLNGDGALTWVDGSTGLTHDHTGTISSANSLVGATGDDVGSSIVTQLLNNNKLVFTNSNWGGGKGSITWMDGSTGQIFGGGFGGVVTGANSLLGSSTTDHIGSSGIILVNDGNYYVSSPNWANGSAIGAGALTLGNGAYGSTVGAVTSLNSLVGSGPDDAIGSGGIYHPGGLTYLVISPQWGNNGNVNNALGAVTWLNAAASKVGAVSAVNSLVGSNVGDRVGLNSSWLYSTLNNGNFIFNTANWNGGRSALTWMNGATGALSDGTLGGAISSANSLLGANVGDNLGSHDYTQVKQLTNGNVVISAPYWGWGANQTSGYGLGAAIWMNGSTGQLADSHYGGVVSASNSLVGASTGDAVGGLGFCDCSYGGQVTALSNGNYIVNSPLFQSNTGAVTWANGSTGLVGVVSSANSVLTHVNSVSEVGTTGKALVAQTSGAGSVYLLGVTSTALNPDFASGSGDSATVGAGNVAATLNTGTNVVLQANNDITVNADINAGVSTQTFGGNLTLQAGRSILVNANIINNGSISLTANDTAADGVVSANRDAGAANLTQAAATTINATTGRVTLNLLDGAGNANHAAGTISQGAGAAIVAHNLDVTTYGGASLTGNNQVSMLQLQNTGAVASEFRNTATTALFLGDQSGIGIRGDLGSIKVTNVGDLSLLGTYGVVSSSAVGDAVVLASSAGNFNDGGISISTPNGRWLVYSTDPRLDGVTANSLGAGDFKQYAAPIGTSALGSGNGFLYSIAPTLSATLTPTVNGVLTKSYDGTTHIALNSNNFTVTNSLQNTDVITVAPMVGEFNSKNVGVANTVTATGLTASATDSTRTYAVFGYQFAANATATGSGAISPASVTLTAPAITKTYDGTTGYTTQAADLAALSGALFTGDTVSAATLAYANKTAGTGNKAVSLNAVTINDGNNGANYTVSALNGNTTSTINRALLTLSTANVTKTYNASTDMTGASGQGAVVAGGTLYAGDSLVGGSFAFTDKNVGAGNKEVTVAGVTVTDGTNTNNYNVSYQNNTTSTINQAPLTVSTANVTKTYNASIDMTGASGQGAVVVGGTLYAGDSLSGGSFAFTDKNAGAGNKTVTVAGVTVTDGTNTNNYNVSYQNNTTSTINPATVTLTAPSISKTYDGTTGYTTQPADLSAMNGALFAGDTVSAATFSYADKNAGSGNKTVSLNAVTINDGNGGANYTVAARNGNATSTIVPLTETWTATAGAWSNAANWSGGFVPDGVNVVTPSTLTVSNAVYDLAMPSVVQTINATGNFTLQSGALTINGDLITPSYTQTGGTLSVSGALTVQNAFSQTAGNIDRTGPVSITQANGNLVVGNISGSSISLQAPTGTITQQASTGLTGFLTVKTSGGANLLNPGNTLTGFAVSDVGLNVPSSGNISLLNHGALDLRGINLASGNLKIETQSPITVSSPVTASGNITLAALTPDGTSNITINAPVTSTAGGITIQAYNNFIQNSGLNAALGIDVSTIAGSMLFGPGAFSVGNPVTYSVNGVPYIPPWIAASLSGGANDFVVTFLDQFLAVLDDPLATVDDPLGLRLRGQEGVVVEGEICKP